ncbi:unnamed protein product [Larinioides sclopetarius]|uniref:Uncharacterized protein n=1 Tax=Larinioides sclopetarius TaxID=280406 RepID=A0AAV2BE87_9ARAC
MTRKDALSTEIKVLCALNFFAFGSYQKKVGNDLPILMSQGTPFSHSIREVSEAMSKNLLQKYGKFPDDQNLTLKYISVTGSVLDKERCGRPRRSDVTVQDIREAFARSPTQSITVLPEILELHAQLVQLLQALNPGGLNCRFKFAIDMLQRVLGKPFLGGIAAALLHQHIFACALPEPESIE